MSIINYTLAYPVHVEPPIVEPQADKWYINISNAGTKAYPNTNDSGINGNYILNSMLSKSWTDAELSAFQTTFGLPLSTYTNVASGIPARNAEYNLQDDYFIHLYSLPTSGCLKSFVINKIQWIDYKDNVR